MQPTAIISYIIVAFLCGAYAEYEHTLIFGDSSDLTSKVENMVDYTNVPAKSELNVIVKYPMVDGNVLLSKPISASVVE